MPEGVHARARLETDGAGDRSPDVAEGLPSDRCAAEGEDDGNRVPTQGLAMIFRSRPSR